MTYKILAINPGSTSTKIAVFADEELLFSANVTHSDQDLEKYPRISDQFAMRKKYVLHALAAHKIPLKSLSAIVGRGGQLVNIHGGGYLVTEAMKKRLGDPATVEHASNLGALIAAAIAEPLGIPAYIYDAVGADEMEPIAKVTGFPEIVRESFCHVLNSKAMARKAALQLGKTYQTADFIVAHLGGGISISAHQHGRIIDVITADGGPFSPERSGSLPLHYLADMCFSGKYSSGEIKQKISGNGGVKAYFGTADLRKIEQLIETGDQKAQLVFDALAYQVAKGIGELSPVLKGKIDAIILTGGAAYSKRLVDKIERSVHFLAPVTVLPGENELESLAQGALRILRGEETVEPYQEKKKEEKAYA
ncbi:MAG: butyrate kinase [Enterococcaceae bacterium]|jgi:butyrate kinase|nr:butyrate kinase [Enterococcaceae bacterium]MCI1918692.1 butyrate kinase [Enterococcaceae bacterium]